MNFTNLGQLAKPFFKKQFKTFKEVNMKTAIKTTIATVLLSGSFAQAGYVCQSFMPKANLKVQKKNYPNRLGADIEILLQAGSNSKYYYGKHESDEGYLLNQQIISIYSQNPTDQLVIVTKAKNCGRGLCDPNDKMINAVLKIENTEIKFNCSET